MNMIEQVMKSMPAGPDKMKLYLLNTIVSSWVNSEHTDIEFLQDMQACFGKKIHE